MRVLIAHNDSAERSALAETLCRDAREAFEIIASADGHEVLELLLDESPPELALVDWDLPGIEGPEMCRLVRDFHQGDDTYLVILASPAHTDTADAWRAGAAQCIPTPVPDGALHACFTAARRLAPEPPAPPAPPAAADEGGGRPTLEAVRTRESDDANVAFFRSEGAESRPVPAVSGADLLQAVLVER
jgi:DNA-binding response OmpR family regulator